MKKELFYTKPKAEEGVKIPLELADGTTTSEWLLVRGIDSEIFQRKQLEVRGAILEAMKDNESDAGFDLLQQKHKADLLACLVADWSFDDECTENNIKEFLSNAPHIADKIDSISADRVFFMQKESNESER